MLRRKILISKRSAGCLAEAKGAHDELIAAAHRAQADAAEIEAQAKRRLADEYDAAQERGEVQTRGGDRKTNLPGRKDDPKVSDIGLTYKQIHEARQIRNAEAVSPGIVRRALDRQLAEGKEPTTAALSAVGISDVGSKVVTFGFCCTQTIEDLPRYAKVIVRTTTFNKPNT